VSVRTLSAGRVLFSQGDTDKRTVWLVSGSVEVNENERNIAMLRSGTPEARTRYIRTCHAASRCAGWKTSATCPSKASAGRHDHLDQTHL